ncbi:MAG: type II secretion system protein M [Gammaproteobacteria bacterium]|nr:type II secretion system protein M [Gammaproteobacteria bacterium]
MSLKARWKHAAKQFAALKSREQALLTLGAVVLILGLSDALLGSPAQKRAEVLRQSLQQQAPELAALTAEAQVLSEKLGQDPDAELRRQLDEARRHLSEEERRLGALTADLIPPERMATVLREVLATRPGLRLVSLKNHPAEPAFPELLKQPEAAPADPGAVPPRPSLYRHGLSLTVEGSYFEVLAYLKTLETLPWHFNFSGLDYRVDKYPRARVRLELYTLSASEDWIGV